MRFMLPVLGLLAGVTFVGAPAFAQDKCADAAGKIQANLQALTDTSEVKQKLAGQLAEGLAKCRAGQSNPWMGVDPRITKGI